MTTVRTAFLSIITATLAMTCASAGVSAEDNPKQPSSQMSQQSGETGSNKAADQDPIRQGELLTLQRCIVIAMERQPAIIAARNTVLGNQSRVGEAQAGYYPQIGISGGYSRGTEASASGSSPRSADDYTAGVTVSQNIYDFGKTSSQVKTQQFNLDASRSGLENTSVQIVFNVKQTYYAAAQAKRNRDLAEEVVRQFEQHLDQAKAFLKVGTSPRFDVIKAEVDVSSSRLNLIRANNSLRIAIANLNNAMGVPDAPDYIIEDNLNYRKYAVAFDDALAKAYANRQDMQAITSQIKAAEQSVAFARAGYLPTVTGNAAYGRTGNDFPLQENWNVGVTISMPLFNGFLTRNQISGAEANLRVLQANRELLKQAVHLDVRQAFLNLKEAEDSIPTAELAVKQATESLDISNGRYATGVGSPVEVTDAQTAYSNAKLAYIQALSDYRIAIAGLEKAQGER